MCFSIGVAQSDYTLTTNTKTPNNSTVSDTYVFTGTEIAPSTFELLLLESDLYSNYNQAELIGPPTKKYNCHAYAWHIREGGNNVWIGYYSTTAHNIYWTDGSYTEVPENRATKVVYTGNHSAVRLNSTWYQSKWGSSALVKHKPTNTPVGYNPSATKKYYIRSTTQHPVQYPACGNTILLTPPTTSDVISYRWEIAQGLGSSCYYLYGATPGLTAQVAFYQTGYWIVHAYAAYSWGESSIPTHEYVFWAGGSNCNCSKSFSAYPNPANNILTIEIDEEAMDIARTIANAKATNNGQSLKVNPAYDIHLYDEQGNLLRQANTRNTMVQFDIANLPNGIYYLHVYDGVSDKPMMQQIIVSH